MVSAHLDRYRATLSGEESCAIDCLGPEAIWLVGRGNSGWWDGMGRTIGPTEEIFKGLLNLLGAKPEEHVFHVDSLTASQSNRWL